MSRIVLALIAVSGAAALVVGVLLDLTARRTAEFGWTAYAPLAGEAYSPGALAGGIGLLLAVLGALMLGVAGTLLTVRLLARPSER